MNISGIEVRELTVELALCTACEDIHPEWRETINKTLTAEFPGTWPDSPPGIPGNHPAWARWRDLWAKHKVRCLCFTYDDNITSLCGDHLKEAVRQWAEGE